MIQAEDFILLDDQRRIGLIPGQFSSPLAVDDIASSLAASPYRECHLDQKAATRFIELVNRQSGEGGSQVPFAVAERVDADLQLVVAKDGMTVRAVIQTAQGGHHLGLPALVDKLHEAKVSFGLQTQRTLQFLKEASVAPPGIKLEAVIAVGREAQNGNNARFERLVETPKERLLRPQPLKNGRVDMRNLGKMCSVRPGDELMIRHPPQEGKDGKNVYGEVLPSTSGSDAALVAGEGTIVSTDDPNKLLADSEGLPQEIENGMRVDEVLAIKEVNVGTGHIDFAGSIVISGDVQAQMKVSARGDIHVLGFVDSAELTAGGDILVDKGIIGYKRVNDDLSCYAQAEGSIHARNTQYTHLCAGKDIIIAREINHCLIESQQNVLVGEEGGRHGLIVGGRIVAGETVRAVVVGSEAAPHTYITIAGEYEILMKRRKLLANHQKELEDRLRELMEAQLASSKISDPSKRSTMQDKVATALQHEHVRLSQVEKEIEENKKAIDLCLNSVRYTSSKRMYANVHFMMAGKEVVSDHEYGPCKAIFSEGNLEFEGL